MHSLDCEQESMRLNHAHIHRMLWMPTLNPHSMSRTGSQAVVIPRELEIVDLPPDCEPKIGNLEVEGFLFFFKQQ